MQKHEFSFTLLIRYSCQLVCGSMDTQCVYERKKKWSQQQIYELRATSTEHRAPVNIHLIYAEKKLRTEMKCGA